ncbi:MAG: DUF5615 family PIN-like protein [Dehalococcoidia bacterium]
MTIGLYLDDDTGIRAAISEAARLGLRVIRSDEAGLRGAPDEQHLEFAANAGLALVTGNRRDFAALHWDWMAQARGHAGILLVHRQIPAGTRIGALLRICQMAEPEDFANRIESLKDWL